MKMLCIADMHGDLPSAKKALSYATENRLDTILILGDFPGHGLFRNIDASMRTAEKILDVFSGKKVLAIPGNCDPPTVTSLFEKRGANLHEKVVEINGVRMAGFGGSNVTPFGTPFEMQENEIYSRMKRLTERLSNAGDRLILAVHCPPKDTECDKTVVGAHAGSSSIRKIIEELQPALVVCSHIHEAGGSTDLIGKSRIANIGRLSNGNIGVLEAGDGISVKLVNLG